MDSKKTPVRVKSGGTKISRRTVTRGVAWSAPIAAVAYAAPAFASSQPVVVQQCGVACKHPGAGQNDKTYHFVFCFKSSADVDGGVVYLDTITVGGIAKDAYSGDPAVRTVAVTKNTTKCYYVDASFFGTSETDPNAQFRYHYFINGTRYDGCAVGVIVGDVCGTSSDPFLSSQPKTVPHGSSSGTSTCAVTGTGATC